MRSPRKLSAMFVIGACVSVLYIVSNRKTDREIALAVETDGTPVTLLGTGASFPAPLYEKWFSEYNRIHPEVQINYQALGGGAGIKQFQQGLVNFAASDSAMTDAEIASVKDGVVMLPLTAGCVVRAYNLPGGPKNLKAHVVTLLGPICHT